MRRAAPASVITFALATALALGHGARAQRSQLVTRPTRASGVAAVELPNRQRQRRVLEGPVASVQLWRPREFSDWWTVELAGAGAADTRRFNVYAASRASVPLRDGQTIRATIDCTSGGWHYVCDGVVESAAGDLLFAASGSGTDGLAPGWHLVGPAARGVLRDGRLIHTLAFEHAGGRTTTRLSGWTSVRAPDGEWLVTGAFSEWPPGRRRVPEAVDYTTYAITRLGAAARNPPAPTLPPPLPTVPGPS